MSGGPALSCNKVHILTASVLSKYPRSMGRLGGGRFRCGNGRSESANESMGCHCPNRSEFREQDHDSRRTDD